MTKRIVVPLLLLVLAAACNRDEPARSLAPSPPPPIGNAANGKTLVAQYGCNVCHMIPGIEGPQGSLGPSLQGIGTRPMISYNTVKNTPENLARFIQEPASLNPQSSMPAIGLADAEAKDIAAYLGTLR